MTFFGNTIRAAQRIPAPGTPSPMVEEAIALASALGHPEGPQINVAAHRLAQMLAEIPKPQAAAILRLADAEVIAK